jgi:hypothetical protein
MNNLILTLANISKIENEKNIKNDVSRQLLINKIKQYINDSSIPKTIIDEYIKFNPSEVYINKVIFKLGNDIIVDSSNNDDIILKEYKIDEFNKDIIYPYKPKYDVGTKCYFIALNKIITIFGYNVKYNELRYVFKDETNRKLVAFESKLQNKDEYLESKKGFLNFTLKSNKYTRSNLLKKYKINKFLINFGIILDAKDHLNEIIIISEINKYKFEDLIKIENYESEIDKILDRLFKNFEEKDESEKPILDPSKIPSCEKDYPDIYNILNKSDYIHRRKKYLIFDLIKEITQYCKALGDVNYPSVDPDILAAQQLLRDLNYKYDTKNTTIGKDNTKIRKILLSCHVDKDDMLENITKLLIGINKIN